MSTGIIIGLSLLSASLVLTVITGLFLFLRKYSSSRGDYYTQEDEGDKLAGDANSAVLRAKTGTHQVKMRREWYI